MTSYCHTVVMVAFILAHIPPLIFLFLITILLYSLSMFPSASSLALLTMPVQAKSLIQTGTCLIHKEAGTEIKRHPAHFQQVSWQTRYWRGEERADCSLKTSRQEIARAE